MHGIISAKVFSTHRTAICRDNLYVSNESKKLLLLNSPIIIMKAGVINTFIGINIPLDEAKGVTNMCKAWEDQKKEGLREGADEQRLVAIRNMLELGLSKNQILTKYSEEEFERAQCSQPVQI